MKIKGFTILELMIAIAVIGVLAAIAIPAYSNYLNRAKVSEAFQLAGPFQTGIAECSQNSGSLNGCNTGESGVPESQSGRYGTISVASGVITYTFNSAAGAALAGSAIIFNPQLSPTSGTLSWTCGLLTVEPSTLSVTMTPASADCHQD